jgi:hypothetical protein
MKNRTENGLECLEVWQQVIPKRAAEKKSQSNIYQNRVQKP